MSDVGHLIDISSFNPVSDWSAVARDGIAGASIKATQATDYANPLAKAQIAGARSVGVAPGSYHFGDHRYDALAQARYFLSYSRAVGLFAGNDELAPMYDAENWRTGNGVEVRWQSRAQLSDHIGTWLGVLRQETDVRRAFVYGSLSWWGSMLVPGDWAGEGIDVLNWVAVYNGDPGNLQGWNHPADALHQHTSDGTVPGIPGRVDKNVTLRGRRIGDLVIKQEDDDMASFTDAEKAELLAGARKVTTNYKVTDLPTRPLAIGVEDDSVGHILSLRARIEEFIASQRIQGSALAALSLAEKDRDDADKARDEAILTILRGLSTGDVDVSELAAKLADELPPGISTQDIVNAFRQVAGKITFGQIPTGG